MSDTRTRTLIVEREFTCAPEKLWRALTQPHLIAEWLMKNDFEPSIGHKFQLHVNNPQWTGVIDCKVLVVEPEKKLAYNWDSMDLETVVTFTLTPTQNGVQLRMEQSGFRAEHAKNFAGAKFGWQNFLTRLEKLVEEL